MEIPLKKSLKKFRRGSWTKIPKAMSEGTSGQRHEKIPNEIGSNSKKKLLLKILEGFLEKLMEENFFKIFALMADKSFGGILEDIGDGSLENFSKTFWRYLSRYLPERILRKMPYTISEKNWYTEIPVGLSEGSSDGVRSRFTVLDVVVGCFCIESGGFFRNCRICF